MVAFYKSLSNIGDWESSETTEAQVVSNISMILKNIFKNTKLKVVIGEISAECTKETRKIHEAIFSGGHSSSAYTGNIPSSKRSKNICGRKADLAVRGEGGVELALCEFKAGRNATTLKKQEGKNLRYNQCVLEALKEHGLNRRIIAFNWGGNRGEMFSLEEVKGVFLATSINGQLVLPVDPRLLNQAFVDTMITFCAWRRHLVALNEEAFVAKIMREVESSRKRKRFATCFSPK
ncbi:hypothetical protein BD560DRAFT_437057 [Blakeslea trispora]|nr:hypothetical protein BD560DRAFT_437057 [Blakeslea trispora]